MTRYTDPALDYRAVLFGRQKTRWYATKPEAHEAAWPDPDPPRTIWHRNPGCLFTLLGVVVIVLISIGVRELA